MQVLPHYPFRDDGILIWNAINKWVSAYVTTWYANDNDVKADRELQAWGADIASPSWGKVNNFGNGQGFDGIANLVEAVTMTIFTAGPQHAAINFAHRTDM